MQESSLKTPQYAQYSFQIIVCEVFIGKRPCILAGEAKTLLLVAVQVALWGKQNSEVKA